MVILENANLIDVTRGQVTPGQYVVIEGDSIVSVEDRPPPNGAAERIDLAGRYHLNYTPAIIFADGSRFAGAADLEHLSKRLDEVAAAKKG